MNNKSIQILRTSLSNIDDKVKDEVLLDGQPFYNKTSKVLYVGDGETKIKDLSCVKDDGAAHLNTENIFTSNNTFQKKINQITYGNNPGYILDTGRYQGDPSPYGTGVAIYGDGVRVGNLKEPSPYSMGSNSYTTYSSGSISSTQLEMVSSSSGGMGSYQVATKRLSIPIADGTLLYKDPSNTVNDVLTFSKNITLSQGFNSNYHCSITVPANYYGLFLNTSSGGTENSIQLMPGDSNQNARMILYGGTYGDSNHKYSTITWDGITVHNYSDYQLIFPMKNSTLATLDDLSNYATKDTVSNLFMPDLDLQFSQYGNTFALGYFYCKSGTYNGVFSIELWFHPSSNSEDIKLGYATTGNYSIWQSNRLYGGTITNKDFQAFYNNGGIRASIKVDSYQVNSGSSQNTSFTYRVYLQDVKLKIVGISSLISQLRYKIDTASSNYQKVYLQDSAEISIPILEVRNGSGAEGVHLYPQMRLVGLDIFKVLDE